MARSFARLKAGGSDLHLDTWTGTSNIIEVFFDR
jgi:hypothetical protein